MAELVATLTTPGPSTATTVHAAPVATGASARAASAVLCPATTRAIWPSPFAGIDVVTVAAWPT